VVETSSFGLRLSKGIRKSTLDDKEINDDEAKIMELGAWKSERM
jgi:hypothetical protein